MVIWLIRAIFIVLIFSLLLMGFTEGGAFYFQETNTFTVHRTMAYVGCAGVIFLGLGIDILVKRKNLAGMVVIFFGIAVGMLIGLVLNHVLDFLFVVYNVQEGTDFFQAKGGIKWIINVLCCYLSIVFIMQTKDDFRFIIPYVEFSKQTKNTCPLILDTSVIIDGRVADIAATGVLDAPLLIPRFVLNELQKIADSSDRIRRVRGRRGLDILNKMQTDGKYDLSIEDVSLTLAEQKEPVDHQLVASALKLKGKLITNDYNLNKVASLRGVQVININELANALKPVRLPGENMIVKLVKPGDQPGQGVGYMDDGTMVVVEEGRKHVGQEVEVIVTSSLQTSAGRMIFGKVCEEDVI